MKNYILLATTAFLIILSIAMIVDMKKTWDAYTVEAKKIQVEKLPCSSEINENCEIYVGK